MGVLGVHTNSRPLQHQWAPSERGLPVIVRSPWFASPTQATPRRYHPMRRGPRPALGGEPTVPSDTTQSRPAVQVAGVEPWQVPSLVSPVWPSGVPWLCRTSPAYHRVHLTAPDTQILTCEARLTTPVPPS